MRTLPIRLFSLCLFATIFWNTMAPVFPVGGPLALAQPASVDPQTVPADTMTDSPPPDWVNDQDTPQQDTDGSDWINYRPTGKQWGIWLIVWFALLFMVRVLYRSLLPGTIRKMKHPATLRGLMFMVAGVVTIVGAAIWFVWLLGAFGWFMMGPIVLLAVVLFLAAWLATK
jgi:hypothetical protein